MNTIDVYSQYFSAQCVYNDIPRRAALVKLVCSTGGGEVAYNVLVTFFPYRDPEDFAISYDACAEQVLVQRKGRRSKKRESALMDEVRPVADALAQQLGGEIDWDAPLREAQYG